MISKLTTRKRKIQATTMYRSEHLEFLNKKIDKNVPHKVSRSAIIEFLVDKAMLNPSLLD